MSRLLVHVEGQTEEEFVNEVLRDYLFAMGYTTVSARIVGNSRQRDRRGGIKPWPSVKKDIVNHLREDAGCIATTMVDYYGLPTSGEKAWPGRAKVAHLNGEKKATFVETALLADIDAQLRGRFIPFVVMHEFEALLFSDCARFGLAIGLPGAEAGLQSIRDQFPTPEDINDSPDTAPSKRVLALVPGYQKPFLGPRAALEIGLDRIRSECPHFNGWLARLEARCS